MKRLNGVVRKPSELALHEKEQMLRLLNAYFDGIERDNFTVDLEDKDYVILLQENEQSEIKGFTTFKLMDMRHREVLYKLVVSGDTIIDKEYWGTMELPKVWLQTVFALREREPEKLWFWLLICSGYKTYRFLPVFFKHFYPRYDKSVPDSVKELMNVAAKAKYGDDYDPLTGRVIFSHSGERLKKGVADVTKERLKSPHVRFFVESNPNYACGEELVCWAGIERSNLTSAGHKFLKVHE